MNLIALTGRARVCMCVSVCVGLLFSARERLIAAYERAYVPFSIIYRNRCGLFPRSVLYNFGPTTLLYGCYALEIVVNSYSNDVLAHRLVSRFLSFRLGSS